MYSKMPDMSSGIINENEKNNTPQNLIEQKAFCYDHASIGE
jgi:hypothetical protein